MILELAGTLWQLAAIAFLALVILTVHKARARGRRLFKDLPLQRLGPPPEHPQQIDHRWDAL